MNRRLINNSFSVVELRLIQTTFSKKSVDEIALILDKPVELVSEKVAEISETFHQETYAALNAPVLERKAIQQAKKEARQRKIDDEKKKLEEKRKRQALLNQQERERKERKHKESSPKYQTKAVDYSQLHAVRIDHKTIVYAKPGERSEDVRKRYLKTIRK